MKRYFQVTPSPKQLAAGGAPKRPRPPEPTISSEGGCPTSFVTFNVNSLNARRKSAQLQAFAEFVRAHDPDFISLQEVRLPAESDTERSRISARFSDARAVQSFVDCELGQYAAYWSLADKGYAGSLTLIRRTMAPRSIRFTLDGDDRRRHHPEGRVSVCVYDEFTVVSTYSPNNGRTPDSLKRRLDWDDAVHGALTALRRAGTPFIWMGDLNVAPAVCDMSHPDFYKRRDQPGCTDAEQQRHRRLLDDADAVDAFRFVNPLATAPKPGELFDGHTWRGHDTGLYARKTMRIDHFVVSRSLASRIKACVTLGPHDWAAFFGSDHCPVRLVLAPPPEDDGTESAADLVSDVL